MKVTGKLGTNCGIFVRNEKLIQLNYPHATRKNTVDGQKFKTFGAALEAAFYMGFTHFESDDDVVVPITAKSVALATRDGNSHCAKLSKKDKLRLYQIKHLNIIVKHSKKHNMWYLLWTTQFDEQVQEPITAKEATKYIKMGATFIK